MCGRYSLRNNESVEELFGEFEVKTSFNIFPKGKILIYSERLNYIDWGFTPYWADKKFDLINARIETLSSKPSFENSTRCLIPADGWYEWKVIDGIKCPFYFHLNGGMFCFGGVYGGYRGKVGGAIVTTESPEHPQAVHDRMPFIVSRSLYKDWMSGIDIDTLDKNTASKIECYQVSKYMNNPFNDDEGCIEPKLL